MRVLATYVLLLDGLNSMTTGSLPTTIFSINVLLALFDIGASIMDTVREPRLTT